LSMRRIAADLDVTTMALYRHVSNREHLILLMADAAFARFPLPEPPPAGWRRRLETSARLQWTMYQHHPWLAQATSFTRPLLAPRALAHTEWVMRALDGLSLDPVTAVHVHATVAAHVRGLAVNLEPEAEAAAHSGISGREWMDGPGARALASDTVGQAFPHLARVPANSLDLGTLFEFGLQRILDGIAVLISASLARRGARRCRRCPAPHAVPVASLASSLSCSPLDRAAWLNAANQQAQRKKHS
jgi:AcrR family transcriptional regulator